VRVVVRVMVRVRARAIAGILLSALSLAATAAQELTIPDIAESSAPRLITVDDVMALREIAAVKVSPDGKRYAAFVRQPDVAANDYRSAWFVGRTDGYGEPLTRVADGGDMRFLILPNGHTSGDLDRPEVQWSPDGEWIAYTAKKDGEVQLWRSKADGSKSEKLTSNASDVWNFAWSDDGSLLYFTVQKPRAELAARAEQRDRNGYNYNEDLFSIFDLMTPYQGESLDPNPPVWVVDLESGGEHLANEAEQAGYTAARKRDSAGTELIAGAWTDAAVPPVQNAAGELAGLKRAAAMSFELQVVYSDSPEGSTKACTDERCSGFVQKVWWSKDGQSILMLRSEGGGRLPGHGLHAWNPRSNEVRTIGSYPDDSFWLFDQRQGSLVIARQSHTIAPQTATIDEVTGELKTLADLNPEIRNVRLGKAERFEWQLPDLEGELAGSFPETAGGYILYPPDFDPEKKYPVFIEPYAFVGFSGSVGHENPLQAYAAAGIVVLSFGYPEAFKGHIKFGKDAQKIFYSMDKGFPYMTMLMNSTTLGLDTAIARGFIDPKRVGIGSISMGTLVPLHLLQHQDRLTAMTIAAGSWSENEYYWPTRKGREMATMTQNEWRPKPEGEGAEFWRQLDIADHIDKVEAPILMHHSLSEAQMALRFMRYLDDAGKPYEAFVYTNELHGKWQPAHLHSIQQRNLDWFRFWLQDYEDPAEEKQSQYQRWRELRKLQCNNPRSLRDYCSGGD
jgi:dipeptidyl aminopeptidase/acylaminoacyl peptidase